MFAVLKTGGKQYKVASGDVLRVEKLDAAAGDQIQFNEILMVGNTVGAPLVADAGVQAEVVDQIKRYEDLGYDEFSFWIDSGMSGERKRASLDRFLNDVMPKLS